jgi:hypothetical protein
LETIFGNTTLVSSENSSLPAKKAQRGLYTLTVEQESELNRTIHALIERQRRLASSTNLSQRFRTLWIAALLDKRLKQCADHEVGELMVIVQGRFGLFEPELAICHHARRRLLLGSAKERLT